MLMMAPLRLFAQELETIISADQITVQPDNIIHATGNVTVRRANMLIRAEAMTVNENTKQIDFTKILKYSDGKSLDLSGKKAVLSDDLSAGIISAAQVLIDGKIRIRAEEIKLKNGNIERAENLDQITSCKECEKGSPLWYFTASSAVNDIEKQNIIYRDVTLRVKGILVSYIPYLRLPSPSVDRARGFLIPGLAITSNLGVGIKLPYFIPIGDSRDLLMTPYLSTKTKTIEYRYRQKLSNGDITINGAFSDDDISDQGIRNYYRVNGIFDLAYGINLKIKAERANDNKYLGDYSYGSVDDLGTDIEVGKVAINKDRLFSSDLNYVRNNNDDNSVEDFYALSGVYKKRMYQTLFPGNLFFEIEGNSSLNIADGGQVTRPPSFAATGLRYLNYRSLGSIKVVDQSFARLSSFVNSENNKSLKEEFIYQYGLSSLFSIPLYQRTKNSTRVLSPKFMMSYNGQEGRTMGNYFVGENQLSIGNVYNVKKLASSSESELGFSISGGLDYDINWNDGRSLDLWFAGVWLQDLTYVQNQNNQYQSKKVNYAGGFQYQNNKALLINGNTLVNTEGKIVKGDLSGKVNIKDFDLSSRYEFIEGQASGSITQDLENINLSLSYNGFENVGVSATRRYDLVENAMASSNSSIDMKFSSGFWGYQFSQTFDATAPEKTAVSAIYDDDCTTVRISLEDSSQTKGSSARIQSLVIMVQLKPFSNFSLPGF